MGKLDDVLPSQRQAVDELRFSNMQIEEKQRLAKLKMKNVLRESFNKSFRQKKDRKRIKDLF